MTFGFMDPLRRFLKSARTARELGGPSWPRQLIEATLLRMPPGRLGLSEYFDYRLFEPGRSWSDLRRYVGWRGEPALDRGNAAHCHVYADDKLRLADLLARNGLPHPKLLASYRNVSPCVETAGAARLQSCDELVSWLLGCEDFPLFAKPVHAGYGRGAFLLAGVDAESGQLVLGQGQRVAVEEWVKALPNPEAMGYLFQSALAPHPDLAALLSERLSSLRVMTLQGPGVEPHIYRAVWKIPRSFNVIDNFESGSTGNLLGAVDLASGRVTRVIQGYGLELRELDRHPDSGLPFAGLTLPDWPRLLDLSLEASRLLPEFRFQHWDIALTDIGPVPLELNLFAAGGTELSQLVEGRGLLEPRLLATCL